MIDSSILIITDHRDLASTWVPSLNQLGAKVSLAECFDFNGWRSLGQYDLIIIDAYTVECDFVAFTRTLRSHFQKVIVLLTYERDERLHLLLYEAGVDDAIVKPMSVPLFLAKISVWLKRAARRIQTKSQLRAGGFRFDPSGRRLVMADGQAKRLSILEGRLLTLFMSNAGLTLESDLIIDRVWPNEDVGDRELLKNLVYRLRRKIEPDTGSPRYIHTVSGQGYVFRTD